VVIVAPNRTIIILVTKREHRVSQPGAAFEMPSVFSNKLVMPRIARRS
jgi:hypothetical protein